MVLGLAIPADADLVEGGVEKMDDWCWQAVGPSLDFLGMQLFEFGLTVKS